MNRLLYVSIAVSISILLFSELRIAPAFAQGACTFGGVYYEGAYVYSMRSDGVLVRSHLIDKVNFEYPHAAPPGRYIALLRQSDNPFFNGLFALREDGAIYFMSWSGGQNAEWQAFAALPNCAPVAVTPSSIGSVKSKYR